MNIMKIKRKNLSNNKKANRKLRMHKTNKQNKRKYKVMRINNKNDNFIILININLVIF